MPILQYVERPGILDLSWGHPPLDALPTRAWAAAMAAALDSYGGRALTYGHGAGPQPLIDWLCGRLGGTRPEESFITAGASHALELITTLLAQRGDVVIADSPTYHLALRILGDHHVELVGAPADSDGIDPAGTAGLIASLRARGRRVPLLYLVPTFANPTGRSLPGERRRALVELADRYGVTVVEDDTYRELAYGAPAPPSLWSLARGAPVVRIGSFAKTVAPGLRLGWVNADPALVRRLTELGYVFSGGGVNHATAMAMAAFGASGAYEDHLRAVRERYAAQRDALVAALRRAGAGVLPPDGGWFLWLRLPAGRSATALLPAAERAGVSYVAGPSFYVGGGGDEYVRLSFSMLGPAQLTEAASRLGRALAQRAP